jgi:hypothetical protein
MLAIILSALTAIVNGAVTAYNKSKDVSITAIQASVGLASAAVQGMSLWIGHPLSPPSILAYSVAIYYGKAIAYDNVISFWLTGHAGFTPGIAGATATVAGVVIAGMFSSGIANIIKR